MVNRARARRLRSVLVLAVLLAGCTGTIDEPVSWNAANGGAAAAGRAGSAAPSGPSSPGAPVRAIDVNRVAIHRLNNTEYDNTVRDLLGVTATPAHGFIADEKALGFDSIAAALGMTDAQYEQYFNAADGLIDAVFADATLRGRILICRPAGDADTACMRNVIASFGRRAWRRPLSAAELDKLVTLATNARALGADFEGSIAQVAKALLSSVPFLYRVELDADPRSTVAHRLDAFELASRLSYLVWSTMPDERLLSVAESGELLQDSVLGAQLARMLDDGKAAGFTSSFAGQWLGLRDLKSHQVEPTVFPDWDEPLRDAMIREGFQYFDQFLKQDRPLSELFTADVSFVDARLAKHYGIAGSKFDPAQPITNARDARTGFLGLASFLTFTSFSYRTAPTLRGKWVLENLLCTEIPPPPANVPQLEEAMDKADSQAINVRERLAEHRTNPQCASCHTILDPIGLGLEGFDAVGRERSTYANGEAVDATGELPGGAKFDGLLELSRLLSKDPRLIDCASEKLLTYALSRQLEGSDAPYLEQLRTRWRDEGLGLSALLEQIVLSEPFRSRRGEAP